MYVKMAWLIGKWNRQTTVMGVWRLFKRNARKEFKTTMQTQKIFAKIIQNAEEKYVVSNILKLNV
jgi:hypothetical protein